MSSTIRGEATLTELDHARLRALSRRTPLPATVQDLVDNADLVPSRGVGPDIVTMYTQLLLRQDAAGDPRKLTICWPEDAEPEAGFLSVMSPLGTALLGRAVGETVAWHTPDGRRHEGEIAAILFQPEASGDYTT